MLGYKINPKHRYICRFSKSISIKLITIRTPNILLYNNYNMILSRIVGESISTKARNFLLSLFHFLKKFTLAVELSDPSERKWFGIKCINARCYKYCKKI